jgi:hypothetical protein
MIEHNGHCGNGHSGNGHAENGHSAQEDSLERILTQGTETVQALTEALHRDDQRLGDGKRASLPRDEKRATLADSNIAGSYFKSKNGSQNGGQVKGVRV